MRADRLQSWKVEGGGLTGLPRIAHFALARHPGGTGFVSHPL